MKTSMAETVDLDKFDYALLREMQADNQTPARVLAERVGLSQSAVLGGSGACGRKRSSPPMSRSSALR